MFKFIKTDCHQHGYSIFNENQWGYSLATYDSRKNAAENSISFNIVSIAVWRRVSDIGS